MPKVSIISPCYNGEKYVKPFLESLVLQTYNDVEFIFINDGSTDKTEDIFMQYKPKLEEKGWKIKYIKQENMGVAEAINTGLQIFSGKYVFFPDSDDILFSNHIAEKVKFMEDHDDLGCAFCPIAAVNENDLDTVLYTMDNSKCNQIDFVQNLIVRTLNVWAPISYILNSQCLLQAIPSRKICYSRTGQNFQLLFPVLLKFKVGYISEVLGKYVVRSSSISHSVESLTEHNNALFDIWLNTILATELTTQQKILYINQSHQHFLEDTLAKYQKTDKVENNGIIEMSHSTLRPMYTRKTIYFLKFIPLVKIKKKLNKTKIYIFGIHLFTIMEKL